MPLPVYTSDEELAMFMRDGVLRAFANDLGWLNVTDGGDYVEIIADVLLYFGVDSVASIVNTRLLRAVSRQEVWKAVLSEQTGSMDYSADNASYSMANLYAQATSSYRLALEEVAQITAEMNTDQGEPAVPRTTAVKTIPTW